MINDLEKSIAAIESKAHSDDPHAIDEANDLIERHPTEARVWSLRYHIHLRSKNFDGAIHDITEAISISPLEPAFFFNRGRVYLRIGKYKDSISDLTRGIELCDLHGSDYYRDTLLFFRAVAYMRIGDAVSAKADLEKIKDDDFAIWVDGLASKKQLLAECEELIRHDRSN
jgi:tetratricopeptide (TPR) repeat protein